MACVEPEVLIIRGEVKEAVATAEARCEVATEHYEDRLRKLRDQGLAAAEIAFKAKQDTLTLVGPKLVSIANDMADLLHNRLKKGIDSPDEKERRKHENLVARSGPKLIAAIQKVSETLDSLSTHPIIETKGVFIGKVDNRQLKITQEEGRSRLAAFKTSTSEVVDLEVAQ